MALGRGDVYFAGWDDSLPSWPWRAVSPIRVARLEDLASRSPGGLVVLGDAALARSPQEGLPPDGQVRWSTLLASPRRAPFERVDAWARLAGAEVVARDRLEARVRACLDSRDIAWPTTTAWLGEPEVADSEGRTIVEALRRSPAASVKAWAASLGVERHRLVYRCRRRFGARPRELLIRFLLASVEGWRSEGVTWKAIARFTGYCNERSLRRALRTMRDRASGSQSELCPLPSNL